MAQTQEASSRLTEGDAKKGQMMLIYLPEGSVIVDRTNVDVNGGASAEVPRESFRQEPIRNDFAPRNDRRYRGAEHIYLRRRHRVDWVHVTNAVFALYLALVLIFPAALSGIFGVHVTIAKAPVKALDVERGQLLITHQTTLDHISAGDLVVVRSPLNGIQMVRAVSDRQTNGLLTTVVTNAGPGTSFGNVVTFPNDREARKITRFIPGLGYFAMVLGNFFVKAMGLLAVLIMNILVYSRKLRRRTRDERLVYIAK